MKLLGISGSLRATSSTAALVAAIRRLLHDGDTLDIYAGLGELPHFSPDLDVDPPPAGVASLRTAIGGSDAIVITSPEYAHGMPGSLKNGLDWLVSAAEPIDKPVLLVCASPGGAMHAHAQFLEVLRTMSMRVVDGGAHVYSRAKLDPNGEVADAVMLATLGRAIEALYGECARITPPPE